MAIKDLGKKVKCQNCEAKFYDFDKKKPVCPKCGTDYVPVKTRARRSATKSENVVVAVDKDKIEKNTGSTGDEATSSEELAMSGDSLTDMPDVEDDDEDDALIQDTSDMDDDDDDDDIAGVVINTDTSDEGS